MENTVMTEQEKNNINEVLGIRINDSQCRIDYYRKYGFTEESKKDAYWQNRLLAYRHFGFTEEALKDEEWYIRLEAYRTLGFTGEALKDPHYDIRSEASVRLYDKNTIYGNISKLYGNPDDEPNFEDLIN